MILVAYDVVGVGHLLDDVVGKQVRQVHLS